MPPRCQREVTEISMTTDGDGEFGERETSGAAFGLLSLWTGEGMALGCSGLCKLDRGLRDCLTLWRNREQRCN